MREGYKDTPIGMIPEDWDIVKIQDIAEVKGGKRIPKGESLVETVTPYPYIRVTDMYLGGIHKENLLYVPEHIQPSIKRYTIGKDDLFISVAGTLGIVGKIPIELDRANLTENADKLTNIKCNKEFLLQVLMSDIIQKSVKNDTTSNAQPKLALTRIQKFLIPLPSNTEQSKIASILSTVDDKIDAINKRITQTQQLKSGLMQRLLTRGIGHTSFKDSPLGEIPESWDVLPLEKIVDQFIVPMRDKPKVFSGETPWCRIEDFNGIYLSKSKSGRCVSDGTIREMNLKVYPSGTVLVSCSADLGRCAITKAPLTTNQTFIGLVPMNNVSNLFLYYKMVSSAIRLNTLSSGTTISYLSREQFENFKLTYPTNPKEQEDIANIIFTIDEKLNVLQ